MGYGVVVVHSSKVEEDKETLMAIFPARFQSERQPKSNAVILAEGQLTLVLVPCNQSKGTCAVLVIEEAEIRQIPERAIACGVPFSKLETTIISLNLPGGATLVATTVDSWKSPLSRKITTCLALTPQTEFLRGQKSPAANPRLIGLSMSGSDSLPLHNPTASSAADQRLFPSLRAQALQHRGPFVKFPLNSRVGVPVETEMFIGQLLLIMRPQNREDDPFWNERIFSKKKRRIIMQLQGKLKRKPKGVLYAGMEISDPMKLGLLASGLCNILLKLMKQFNPHIHYSFGNQSEHAHICFPASTFFERLVVTRPGERPPVFGVEFEESATSIRLRKSYQRRIDWNTDDVYSMSFHSQYLDFPTWSVVNLPMGPDMSLMTFWGNSLARVVFYDIEDPKKHQIAHKSYILAVQMEFLGKYATSEIEDEDIESRWNKECTIRSSEAASVSIMDEGFTLDITEEKHENNEEFFDTMQNDSISGEHPAMITSASSYVAVLHAIDECCPCVIDILTKRGNYNSVYVFRGQEGQPLFRTWETSVKFLGYPESTDVMENFSRRISSGEKTRRILGLHYAQACSKRACMSQISNFQQVITPYDKSFLQRKALNSKKGSVLKASYVARAISDRHWIEEWSIIREHDILFYRIDKKKLSFRIGFSSIVKVEELNSFLKNFFMMTIETFGRTHYLIFHSKEERNGWLALINQSLSLRVAQDNMTTSIMNHLVNVDNPTDEFFHNSTMFDCNKRRVLNCRRFSFRTPSAEGQKCPLLLVEEALKKATSLKPKGSSDSDLREFLDSAAALKDAQVHSLNEDERLAFFLNVYHVMIMHAFIILGPPDSSYKLLSDFNRIAFHCSDDIFSLAELEHNIIRARMSCPSQFLSRFVIPKSQYRFALVRPDFRINFALNCGSLSIPSGAVPLYKPDIVHEQLDSVMRSFLHNTVFISGEGSRDVSASLPRVCQWFCGDFLDGTSSDVLKTIGPYLTEEKRKRLSGLWNEHKKCYDVGIWNIKYRPYNWECRFLTLDL